MLLWISCDFQSMDLKWRAILILLIVSINVCHFERAENGKSVQRLIDSQAEMHTEILFSVFCFSDSNCSICGGKIIYSNIWAIRSLIFVPIRIVFEIVLGFIWFVCCSILLRIFVFAATCELFVVSAGASASSVATTLICFLPCKTNSADPCVCSLYRDCNSFGSIRFFIYP